MFDHAEGQGNDLTKVISTVAEIQKLTGIDFKTPNAKAETTKGSLWAVDYGALTDAKRKQCKG